MSITEAHRDEEHRSDAEPRAVLSRQGVAFVAEGPPSVAVRRHRIDRLLALVLDNTDEIGATELFGD